jgi:hypothetical protein
LVVPGLEKMQREVRSLLSGLGFRQMESARVFLSWIDRKEFSHQSALELVAFALVKNKEV